MSGTSLAGKLIVLGVTGSIAATETVKLCHELRRGGAEVQAVMTMAAGNIISPDALEYATGRPVITRCSGQVEHVLYCGEGGRADLLLVAPCTANTIGKMASAIDDTPVTTFVTTAVGRGMPIIIAPAMHESMYRHPGVCKNLETLEEWGIDIIPPRIEEGRAKIATIEEIVLHCRRGVSGQPLKGSHVLITSGACREPVDDVRVITTRSTGMMGRALAMEAFCLGAEVTVIHEGTFPCVGNIHVSTAGEMGDAVYAFCDKNPVDFYLSAAAVSDFAPERVPGKIPSGDPVTLHLTPLPKIIEGIRKKTGRDAIIVAFKVGSDAESKARLMLDHGIDLVVVNPPEMMGAEGGTFVILTRQGRDEIRCTKQQLAGELWKRLL